MYKFNYSTYFRTDTRTGKGCKNPSIDSTLSQIILTETRHVNKAQKLITEQISLGTNLQQA